ncbi:hypothetical protein C5688_17600 [Methylocystis sp. MitZ-2018]|jgi:hypothetical protein|nr:hypothetical protein C5688_17600 [Methylocystis sp. MitZ-2018]
MSREPRLDIHQEITSRVVSAIEDGAGEFRLPWNRGGASGRPRNIASGKHYNGVNVLALWVAALHQGYTLPIWGTYRQWQEKGCQVRRGEKSSLVVFYKTFSVETDREDATASDNSERLIARASYVFNADQVEGYAAPEKPFPQRRSSLRSSKPNISSPPPAPASPRAASKPAIVLQPTTSLCPIAPSSPAARACLQARPSMRRSCTSCTGRAIRHVAPAT